MKFVYFICVYLENGFRYVWFFLFILFWLLFRVLEDIVYMFDVRDYCEVNLKR